MKLSHLIESATIYYHGYPHPIVNGYDMNSKPLNRGSNVRGLYLTTQYKIAKDKYAGDSGIVYKVQVSPKNTFTDRSTPVNTPEFIEAYTQALLKYTNYKRDWIEEAIVPELVETGRMKPDLSGDAKRDTLITAGYDSYIMTDMDGPVLVVLDLSIVTSFTEFDITK